MGEVSVAKEELLQIRRHGPTVVRAHVRLHRRQGRLLLLEAPAHDDPRLSTSLVRPLGSLHRRNAHLRLADLNLYPQGRRWDVPELVDPLKVLHDGLIVVARDVSALTAVGRRGRRDFQAFHAGAVADLWRALLTPRRRSAALRYRWPPDLVGGGRILILDGARLELVHASATVGERRWIVVADLNDQPALHRILTVGSAQPPKHGGEMVLEGDALRPRRTVQALASLHARWPRALRRRRTGCRR
mmetsp:Transcript_35658/g.112060  ORF Transcript_35658/g.112060 Transcript_35658/m.112060 type:complete len:245 (-) Transcript_35658:1410-2144(-)